MSGRRLAVVSGGSRGLGAAIVKSLLDDGVDVATFSRTKTPFLEEQLSRAAGLFWQSVDAADVQALRRFASATHERYGQVDVLVNNAGVAAEGLFALAKAADISQTLRVNLEGVIHLTQAISRMMLVARRGVIVNVSSLNGIRGHRGVGVYSATKAALDGLTRSLARELGPRGIRVNSVAPGYFESDMTAGMPDALRHQIVRRTPLGRLGRIDDVVEAVRFLISDGAGFVTGQTLVVDGGITC